MNPMFSILMVTALVVVSITLVLTVGGPIIEKSQITSQIQDAEIIIKHIDNHIKHVVNEGNGSSRIFSFSTKGGYFDVIPEQDVLQYRIEGPNVFEYLSRKKVNDIYYISGNDVDCYESGNTLVMENTHLNITFNKTGSSGTWQSIDTTSSIISMTQKDSGITIQLSNTSLEINDNPVTASGNGYSEILKTGSGLPLCIVHFFVNSTNDYDIYYTLFSGADFLVQEVRGLTAKELTTNLAFHISSNDLSHVNGTSYSTKNWSYSGWNYRRNITITNNNNTISLTNFQVNLSVPYDSDMQDDYDDLRFTFYNSSSDSETNIDYWTENYTTTSVNIWLNVTDVPAANSSRIYMYYGNSGAGNISNFSKTFTKQFNITANGSSDSTLKGEWHFDEGSGDYVYDSSGNGNTGSLGSGMMDKPTWNGYDGGQWDNRSDVNFSTGNSLWFDNSDDYVNCSNSSSLNFVDALTVEAWIYPEGWGEESNYGFGRIVDKLDYGTYTGYNLFIANNIYYNNESLAINIIINGIGYSFSTPDHSISLNQWQHIAMSYDGETVRLFINGKEKGNLTSPSGNLNDHSLVDLIIGNCKEQDRTFNGTIDEVRIYNRSLSADEIYQHYIRSKYVNPKPTYSISSDEERYTTAQTFTPEKKYITGQGNNTVAGLFFAGSHFYNISLDPGYSTNDYLFQLRQDSRDNKILIPFTQGSYSNVDDNNEEIEQDKLVGKAFGVFSVAEPSEVWTYLMLIYTDINLTDNTRWSGGDYKLFIENNGKINEKTKIGISLKE